MTSLYFHIIDNGELIVAETFKVDNILCGINLLTSLEKQTDESFLTIENCT